MEEGSRINNRRTGLETNFLLLPYSYNPPPPLNTPLFDIHERKSIILNAYTSKELHS